MWQRLMGDGTLPLMGPLPLALAMVVSDAIWIDPGSGKKTILGTFSAVYGRQFPLRMDNFAVYLALTDARGMVGLALRLIDVDELRQPVIEHTLNAEFTDPIAVLEGTVSMPVVFPEPGEYRLQLLADGELIIERRIVVVDRREVSDDSTSRPQI